MKTFRGCTGAFVAALLLATVPAVALAGATHLTVSKEKKTQADLKGYDRVVVTDFTDASQPKFDNPEDEAEYRKTVAEGGRKMADMLAAMIVKEKIFKEVSR